MKKFIIFILLFSNVSGFGQQSADIDSLYRVAEGTKVDTNKVNALLYLAENLYLTYPDSAYHFAEEAYSASGTISYYFGIANSADWLGYLSFQMGDVDTAITFFNQSYEIWMLLNHKFNMSNSLNSIATIYMQQGHIQKALETYHRALKHQEENNDLQGMANSIGNLAALYGYQGNFEKSMEYNFRGLKIRLEIGDSLGMGATYNNIGFLYQDRQQYDSALYYYEKGLEVLLPSGDLLHVAKTYQNVGTTYHLQGKYSEALDMHLKSLELMKSYNDRSGMASCYTAIGELMFETNQWQQAEQNAVLGYQLSKELGFPKLIQNSSKLMSDIYQRKGKYKDAFEMYQLYIQMRDSVLNLDNEKATFKQSMQYEYDKEKLADSLEFATEQELLDAKLKKQEAENESQRLKSYYLYGGLAIAILFGGFIFNRFKVTNRQKNIIEEQKQIVDEKNKEILDSIVYAKRIQSAILPPDKVFKELLPESFVLYKPKDIVAGDFYWLEKKQDKILFAVADCTGHGVPGAMVSVICNNGLNRSVREHGLTEPGAILDSTREIVVSEFEKSEEEVKDGMDIALCSLGSMTSTGASLQYSGANNPLWIIRKGGNDIEEFKANKQPIGKYQHSEPFETHTIEVNHGDTIYIFSDGYVDQFGGDKGKKFKASNLKELILSVQSESLSKQKEILDRNFENWRGGLEQVDDVCMIGIRI